MRYVSYSLSFMRAKESFVEACGVDLVKFYGVFCGRLVEQKQSYLEACGVECGLFCGRE